MNPTLEEKASTFWRITATVAIAAALVSTAGCGFRRRPSTVVEDFCRTIERGDIDRAAAFMSQGIVGRQGIDSIKDSLRQATLWLKNDGGIKSIKVVKEDTVGDVAEVTLEITRGAGDSSIVYYKLIREQGDWKIDAIASDSGGDEP